MKKLLILLLLVLLGLGLSAVFYLKTTGHTIVLTEEDLRGTLARQLPMTNRYMGVTEVTLDNQRLELKEGSDRIDVTFGVSFSFVGIPLSLSGDADVSGGLRYEPETHQIFVTDPEVEELRVGNIPEQYAEPVNLALGEALAQYYQRQPLYTLKDSVLKEATARALLRDVEVQDGEVVLTLGL